MDIKNYIASGIVESYVLGMASDEEKSEFEKLSSVYPELIKERLRFESKLEQKAFENAVAPRAEIKDNILNTIRRNIHRENDEAKIISMNDARQISTFKIKHIRWAVAASVVSVFGCAIFLYSLHTKNRQLETEIAKTKNVIETLDTKSMLLEQNNVPAGAEIKQVKVITPTMPVQPVISVFWDTASSNVYLVIKELEPLPVGEKYNVWSVTKGKYKSMGLFDAPTDKKLVLKMNDARSADSFALTIEKKDR